MKKILLLIILIITFSCKQKQCCKGEMEVEDVITYMPKQ